MSIKRVCIPLVVLILVSSCMPVVAFGSDSEEITLSPPPLASTPASDIFSSATDYIFPPEDIPFSKGSLDTPSTLSDEIHDDCIAVRFTGATEGFQKMCYYSPDGNLEPTTEEFLPAGVTVLLYLSPEYTLTVENGTIIDDEYNYSTVKNRIFIPDLEDEFGPFINVEALSIHSHVFYIIVPNEGILNIEIALSENPLPSLIPMTFYNENTEYVGGIDHSSGYWLNTLPNGSKQHVIVNGASITVSVKQGYTLEILEGGQITEIGTPTTANWHPGYYAITVQADFGADELVIAAVKQGEHFQYPDQPAPNVPSEQDSNHVFQDVTENSWYYDIIQQAYSNGIVRGVTEDTFDPNGLTTRGQTVIMLHRAMGSPRSDSCTFSDVSGNELISAVGWATSTGAVLGVTNTSFDPHSPITREQLATILYRMAGSPTSNKKAFASYPDGADIQSYACNAVDWAIQNGLIQGYDDGTLRPSGYATRAEVCALIMRFIAM